MGASQACSASRMPARRLPARQLHAQGRTGPQLLTGLPRYTGKLGQVLLGRPQADVCQSITDLHQVLGLPHYGLMLCRVSSWRPTGAGRGVLSCAWASASGFMSTY